MTTRSRLVLILSLATMGVGCFQPRAATDNRITVTYSCGLSHDTGLVRQIQAFERQNPSIHLELQEQPAQTDTQHNQYATYLIAEDPTIDVYAVDVIWPAEFGSAGWARQVDDRMPAEAWNAFLPGPLAACRYKGATWAVPWYTDAGMMYYRKDLLDEAHLKVPETWDEFATAAQALQRPGIVGYVGQWKQYEGLVCDFAEYVWGNGGDILDPKTGHVVIDSPNNVEALQFMTDMIYKYKIAPQGLLTYDEDSSLKDFMAGKAAFMRNWPYAWSLCQRSPSTTVAGKVGVAPWPHGPKGQSAATLGGWNLMISAYSKHPDEAWKWVQFLTSASTQKAMYLDSSILPTRQSVYEDPDLLQKEPELAQFYQVFKGSRPRPVTPYYSQVSDVIQATIDPALTHKETPAEALKRAQAEIQSIRGFAQK